MVIFNRTIEKNIEKVLFKKKAILIFGPRQAGKTTLVKKLAQKYATMDSYYNCDELRVRDNFREGEPYLLKELIGNKKFVVFDEAQTIQNIGKILKVFIDTFPDIQIIATGSSSFDLANKVNEPLTGRTVEFTLLPLSLTEIQESHVNVDLDIFMRFGMYPEVISEENIELKRVFLENITTNYLYKDIFIFEKVKNPKIVEDLLKLLAYQIGNEVSMNELAKTLGASRDTIEKYLRLLEQSYIIYRVNSFAQNRRDEIKKSFKIYFIDIGIRNMIIESTVPFSERADKGSVFENLVFLELLKQKYATFNFSDIRFWRTRQGLEVDFILQENGALNAFECKWSEERVVFNKFLESYPNSITNVITTKNIVDFFKDKYI